MLCNGQNIGHHGLKPNVLLILQAHNPAFIHGNGLDIWGSLQQAFRLQLLAAESHHQHFAAKVRVERQIM
ncbi:hypothetical protein D3C75_1107270 [compost metagenome]